MALFQVDEFSGIPIWLQVKNGLLRMIMSGYFQQGEQLYTVRKLAALLSINYNTVNKAYMELERDGFIVSSRGKGTFVTGVNNINKHIADSLIDSFTDDFIQKAFGAGLTSEETLEIVSRRLRKLEEEAKEARGGSGEGIISV